MVLRNTDIKLAQTRKRTMAQVLITLHGSASSLSLCLSLYSFLVSPSFALPLLIFSARESAPVRSLLAPRKAGCTSSYIYEWYLHCSPKSQLDTTGYEILPRCETRNAFHRLVRELDNREQIIVWYFSIGELNWRMSPIWEPVIKLLIIDILITFLI